MKTVLLALLRAYQLGISPFLGQNCRFYPSCSEYAAEAVREHGALKGGALATRRLCKCHPWHPGGVDPVPKKTAEHAAPTSHDGGPLAGRAADSSPYSHYS
jgi:putative membrane protein insertion efficiency factor